MDVHDCDGRYDFTGNLWGRSRLWTRPRKIAWEIPLLCQTSWPTCDFAYVFIHSLQTMIAIQCQQTADLIRRFEELKKPYESILIPGEYTIIWMRWENMVRVDQGNGRFSQKNIWWTDAKLQEFIHIAINLCRLRTIQTILTPDVLAFGNSSGNYYEQERDSHLMCLDLL